MSSDKNVYITDLDSDYNEETTRNIIVKNRDAIRNLVFNLLSCNNGANYNFQGDRLYEPTYGCMLERKLFEPVDEFTASDITEIIYDAVTDFLPELNLMRSNIATEVTDDNQGYRVVLIYSINNIQDILRFTLHRGDSNAND